VDITPEYASKLGAAYGAIFKGKGKIGVSSDDSAAAKMLKMSFMSGLLSAGLKVLDFGVLHLPVANQFPALYVAYSLSKVSAFLVHRQFRQSTPCCA